HPSASAPRLRRPEGSSRAHPGRQGGSYASRGKSAHHAEPVRSGDEQRDRPLAHRDRRAGEPHTIPGRHPRSADCRHHARACRRTSHRGFGGSELMKPYFLFLPIPVLLLTSCGSEPARRAAQSQTPPVAVQTAVIATQDWPTSYEATGTVRARTTATISSKVMGYVQQVNAQVGDHVRQGQALITLDARDLDVSLRRA